MSGPDANGWLPIEDCPVTSEDNEDAPRLLLWVVNGGFRGKGCPAFGIKHASGNIRASGFLGDFKFSHFQIVKPPVQP